MAKTPKRRRWRKKRGVYGAAVEKIKHPRMRKFFRVPQEGEGAVVYLISISTK